MKKNLLFAVMAAGVVAFSATVYFQGNSASSDLLLANVEALSGDEGVDDCDIFTYVRDAVEGFDGPYEVTEHTGIDGKVCITVGGVEIPVSGTVGGGSTYNILVGSCNAFRNNCCLKTHIGKIKRI
ncbi:hypothetical protein [Alistipes sp. cv1]|jgi:hypothetical protein|uniref:hypothetical protein n=1 Tax=Alistipes sp. cv1 TaxID=1622071 RepID=UPI0011AF2E49|nr:hypothetical protein [Alistipes sp. cv1]